MWEVIRSADCKEERCVYSNRCVSEGKVLPCWLLICTVLRFLKGRGWEGTLGSAWVLSAVLPPFLWVFGWLVGGWVVGLFVFFLVLCCCQCYYLLIIECQFTLLFVRLEGEAGKQKKCNYLLKLHTAKMPECFLATRNRKAVHWEFWQYLETGCVDVFGLIPEELQCSRSQRLNMRRLFFYLLVGSRELWKQYIGGREEGRLRSWSRD